MNNISIMQPYLFPYIGYFHLIMASDIFVIYDDVNYIKQGYINRNNILFNGEMQRFTLPVPGSSSNKYINELYYTADIKKILTTIKQAYSKSQHFDCVFPLIEDVLKYENRSIPVLCKYSFEKIFSYLDIKKTLIFSSDLNMERDANPAQRLIDICKVLKGDTYINSPGGRALYKKEFFDEYGIDLKFIDPIISKYQQINSNEFVPFLSIIDILMNNSPESIKVFFQQYSLKD